MKRKIPDIAGLYAEKSQAKDVTRRAAGNLESTLWLAAESGYAPVVRVLIKRGADIDKTRYSGNTPLLIASEEGHLEVVKTLLDSGADATLAAEDGMTPLEEAKSMNHREIVSLLKAAIAAAQP